MFWIIVDRQERKRVQHGVVHGGVRVWRLVRGTARRVPARCGAWWRGGGGAVQCLTPAPAQCLMPSPAPATQVWNPSFDVTPASLITGIITEQGMVPKAGQAFQVRPQRGIVMEQMQRAAAASRTCSSDPAPPCARARTRTSTWATRAPAVPAVRAQVPQFVQQHDPARAAALQLGAATAEAAHAAPPAANGHAAAPAPAPVPAASSSAPEAHAASLAAATEAAAAQAAASGFRALDLESVRECQRWC